MNIKRLTYIGLFACLTALGALITVPIPPLVVPITLQIPFTLTAGFILGPRDGAVSQLLYLLLGAVGLPVFSGQQGGIGMLWGPTAGFLWGFVLAAFLIGWLSCRFRFRSFRAIFLALIFGLMLIYAAGVIGLMLVLDYSFGQALGAGVAPFVLVDVFKLLVSAYVVERLIKTGIVKAASKR
ncbi:MAG: biotin transporter BioY [Candidatus Wallacebacter cryptica]|jgi:biotin transport system substrate-specific component|nr:biotin transporter BioY [Bacillota bacterium]